jgi:hypothetical protein
MNGKMVLGGSFVVNMIEVEVKVIKKPPKAFGKSPI